MVEERALAPMTLEPSMAAERTMPERMAARIERRCARIDAYEDVVVRWILRVK